MSYDSVRDVYRAHGNVVITYSGGTLYAEDVELDNKNNIATAQGNAILKSGEDNVLGDKIIFNITPSPGASTCLGNAYSDASKIVEFLGNKYKFNKEAFEKDLM